ncbi:G patch domain-containing protein 1-like [Plakobranchus ocellatus]|uniref:G patch domain-containing protein 1-like n=1 Tax=Plakobranchus ocellatus TaxID=259542 RepID=A0AAV3YT52_9GAST|nr:G patch domain-containing protein 1-like [Plakobranchus ocellatus]
MNYYVNDADGLVRKKEKTTTKAPQEPVAKARHCTWLTVGPTSSPPMVRGLGPSGIALRPPIASLQQGELRLSGFPSGKGSSGGTRTRDRRIGRNFRPGSSKSWVSSERMRLSLRLVVYPRKPLQKERLVTMLLFCLLCLSFLSAAVGDPPPYATRPTCGNTNRTCIAGQATCVDSKCKCGSQYQRGKGNFGCYVDTTQSCEIKNDPSLQTYSNEADQFPFPCRYLASHVRTDLISMYGNTIGICEARIYAFNSKSKGKFYVSGFDVGITFITYSPPNATSFSYRRFVTTANHVNTASSNGHIGQAVPFIHDGTQNITFQTSDGIGLTSSYQNTNNRFVFKNVSQQQRLTVDLRRVKPANYKLLVFRGLEMRTLCCLALFVRAKISGLSALPMCFARGPLTRIALAWPPISVYPPLPNHHKRTYTFSDPTFLSPDAVMCLPKPAYGGQLLEDIQEPSLTVEESLLLRAFLSDQPQNQPHPDDGQCSAISSILAGCKVSSRRLGIKRCSWMLKRVPFVKCYDNTPGALPTAAANPEPGPSNSSAPDSPLPTAAANPEPARHRSPLPTAATNPEPGPSSSSAPDSPLPTAAASPEPGPSNSSAPDSALSTAAASPEPGPYNSSAPDTALPTAAANPEPDLSNSSAPDSPLPTAATNPEPGPPNSSAPDSALPTAAPPCETVHPPVLQQIQLCPSDSVSVGNSQPEEDILELGVVDNPKIKGFVLCEYAVKTKIVYYIGIVQKERDDGDELEV